MSQFFRSFEAKVVLFNENERGNGQNGFFRNRFSILGQPRSAAHLLNELELILRHCQLRLGGDQDPHLLRVNSGFHAPSAHKERN